MFALHNYEWTGTVCELYMKCREFDAKTTEFPTFKCVSTRTTQTLRENRDKFQRNVFFSQSEWLRKIMVHIGYIFFSITVIVIFSNIDKIQPKQDILDEKIKWNKTFQRNHIPLQNHRIEWLLLTLCLCFNSECSKQKYDLVEYEIAKIIPSKIVYIIFNWIGFSLAHISYTLKSNGINNICWESALKMASILINQQLPNFSDECHENEIRSFGVFVAILCFYQ